jgi:uncharacterized membrane protein
MNIYFLLLLRLIHIVAGVAWVGGAVVHTLFIEPSARATAPESGKFMQHFMVQRRFSVFMTISSLLTVAAGGLLFWYSSGGLKWAWISSGPGTIFSIGSVVAIFVFFLGLLMIKPRAERMGELGSAIAAAGGPPAPEQVAELHKIDRELSIIGRVDFALLLLALVTMATARYWYI